MENQTNYSMRTLRAAAIFLVVLLHVNAANLHLLESGAASQASAALVIFFSVFTRVAVPLFVLISGRYVLAGLEKTRAKDHYKKRIPRLLIPLLAWSLIYFLFCSYKIPGATPAGFLKDFAEGFARNGAAIHLWYLYMLAGLYLIAPPLYAALGSLTFRRKLCLSIALCVCGSLAELLKNMSGVNLWYLWWLEFTGLFSLGYVLSGIKPIRRKYLLLIGAAAIEVLAAAASMYLFAQNNILAALSFHWGVVPHTQIAAVLTYLFFHSANFGNNAAAKAAPYTLGVYLLHFCLVSFLPKATAGWAPLIILLYSAYIYILSLGVVAALSRIRFLKKILQ